MAAQLRAAIAADSESHPQGLGEALKSAIPDSTQPASSEVVESPVVLKNRAGESKSPYVRAHATNPVAWQLWGDEAIELARKENKLLFVSIGYSACHCMCFRSLEWLRSKILQANTIRVSCHGA